MEVDTAAEATEAAEARDAEVRESAVLAQPSDTHSVRFAASTAADDEAAARSLHSPAPLDEAANPNPNPGRTAGHITVVDNADTTPDPPELPVVAAPCVAPGGDGVDLAELPPTAVNEDGGGEGRASWCDTAEGAGATAVPGLEARAQGRFAAAVAEQPDFVNAQPEESEDVSVKRGTGVRRRRLWRILSLFLATGLAVAFFVLWAYFVRLDETIAFDPRDARGLQVTTTGCDVVLRPGDRAEVRVERWRWFPSPTAHTFVLDESQSFATALTATNEVCNSLPNRDCSKRCRVTVTCPRGDTDATRCVYLRLQQDSNDEATRVKITSEEGFVLERLYVKGTSFEVTLRGLVSKGDAAKVQVTTSTNAIFMSGADLQGSTNQLTSDDAGVFVRDSNVDAEVQYIEYRVTNKRLHVTAQPTFNITGIDVPAQKVAYCDMASESTRKNIIKWYDADRNGKVTTDEFQGGLDDLGRCGDKCSFSSTCASLTQDIYGISDTNLKHDPLIAALEAFGDYALVPKCYQLVTISPSSLDLNDTAAVEAAVSRTVRLQTNNGELRWDAPGSVGSEGIATGLVNYFSEVGHVESLCLTNNDQNVLNALRDEYGYDGESDDLFTRLDILESPGVPASPWVWSTRSVLALIEPTYTQIFTNGVLNPIIVNARVHMTNGYSEAGATGPASLVLQSGEEGTTEEAQSEWEQTKFVEMAKWVTKALTPSGQNSLKGVLIRLPTDYTPLNQNGILYAYVPTTGEVKALPYTDVNAKQYQSVQAMYWISIVIGFIAGVAGTAIFLVYTRSRLKELYDAEKVKNQVLDDNERGSAENDKRANEELDSHSKGKSFNPFETPMALSTMLFVEPLRRQLINSVRKFVSERCKVTDKKVLRGRPRWKTVPGVDMDEWIERYNRFCYTFGLNEEKERGKIRRLLIDKYHVRIFRKKEKVISGCRWKTPNEIAGTMQTSEEFLDRARHNELTSDDFAREFVRLRVAITGRFMRDNVTLSTSLTAASTPGTDNVSRVSAHANTEKSFAKQFQEFGLSLGQVVRGEDISAATWADMGIKVEKREQNHIKGMEFLDFQAGDRAALRWTWYAMESLTVVIHLCVLCGIPIYALFLLFQVQWAYALTTATDPNVLTMYDLVDVPPDTAGRAILTLTSTVAYVCFGLFGLAFLRLLIKYATVKNIIGTAARKFYSWVLTVFFAITVGYFVILMVWMLLAAMLAPTRFLPQGIGVLTVVVSLTVSYKMMKAASNQLREKTKNAVDDFLLDKLRSTKTLMDNVVTAEIEAHNGGMRRRRGNDGSAGTAAEVAKPSGDQLEELNVEDVFNMLDTETDVGENGEEEERQLSFREFSGLFEMLDIKVPLIERQKMFAYCDSDFSNKISFTEFEVAWDYLKGQILEQMLNNLGLSDESIVITVILLATCLVLILAFIFIAIAAWSDSTQFNSVVQTTMVTATGLGGTLLRKKKTGEGDSAELDAAVNSGMEVLK